MLNLVQLARHLMTKFVRTTFNSAARHTVLTMSARREMSGMQIGSRVATQQMFIGCASRTSSVLMLCAMSLPFAVQFEVTTEH